MGDEPKLKKVKRLDSVPLEKVEYTPERFLIDHPIVTSVGVFEYTNPDGSVRRELRLPEHVFDEKSLATYEGKPVIITHEAGQAWLGGFSIRSIGEYPNAANESSLLEILEPNAHPKYSLSSKASLGILTRADRKKKELPLLLSAILKLRAGLKKTVVLQISDEQPIEYITTPTNQEH